LRVVVSDKMSTWRVSYKRQEVLTLREHLCSPPVFGKVRVPRLFVLCCVFSFCLSSSRVLRCPVMPVYQDCPIVIALLVLSNVYFETR
jgi:hypothetical protein